jgi:PTS system ascorbate-specific IIB component
MLHIVTVCGNGIGSSLILRIKIEEICREEGIDAHVESTDFNSANALQPDLIVTIAEFAKQFGSEQKIAVVRSYINKGEIRDDIMPLLKTLTTEAV